MLKQRIITAIILIPIFVSLVLKLPPQGFCFLTGLLVIGCAFEWSGLMGLSGPKSLIYPFLMIIFLINALWLVAYHYVSIPIVLYAAFIWWLIAALWVYIYPKASQVWGNSVVVRSLMGIMTLVPCWLALNFIRVLNHGEFILLILFVLIWGADIGALFCW